jgi:hypothetical protein
VKQLLALSVIGLCTVVGGASTAGGIAVQLEFTRATLTAVRLGTPPRFHRLLYEDEAYKFFARNYGSGGETATPGLFVYSKARDVWIQILSLSTEHARLGRAPDFNDIPLSVDWDYRGLVNRPFASIPLQPGGSIAFPDRIADFATDRAYRLDFHSNLNRDVSLTWFWLAKADLAEAFEGRMTPDRVDKRDLRGVPFSLHPRDGLIVAVRVGSGEALRWRVDPKVAGIVVDADTTRIGLTVGSKDPRLDLGIGDTVLLEQPVTVGSASRIKNIGGVLGTGLFDRFALSLDYDSERLRLIDPAAPPGDGEPIAVAWQLGGPVLNARIVEASGRTRDARLCVDVAEPKALLLRQPASATRRLRSLRIGSYRFDNLPVFSATAVDAGCDGVLGDGLLRRFRVTFDRGRQRLLLAPAALFDVQYDYDLTGLTVVRNGRAFVVGRVDFETIAAAAGFQPGDVILAMDGQPVAGMELRELRASFHHDGRERVLTIQRLGVRNVLKLAMPLVK